MATPDTVALLRAVNVGGRRVGMAELRELAAGMGLDEVSTYLQSGNLVFAAAGRAEGDLASDLESSLGERFGIDIPVIVRGRERLRAAIAANPFSSSGLDPKLQHVVFLAAAPGADSVAGLDPDRSPQDEFRVDGDHVYVAYPNGSGRSKLTLDYFERVLGTVGTARNLNTATALLGLVG